MSLNDKIRKETDLFGNYMVAFILAMFIWPYIATNVPLVESILPESSLMLGGFAGAGIYYAYRKSRR